MGFGLRLGFDIGKDQDYSALCTTISSGMGSDTVFSVPDIHRFELNISFPDQVDMLEQRAKKALSLFYQHVDRQQIQRQEILKPALLCDYTGLGTPVFDIIKKTSIPKMFRLVPCKFVGGDKLTPMDAGYNLGKQYFVSRLLVLSQEKRIRLNAIQRLKNPFIEREFKDFDIEVDESTGKAKYGAMRSGSHDDMVCAMGLACLLDNPSRPSYRVPSQAVAFPNQLLQEANASIGFRDEEPMQPWNIAGTYKVFRAK